MVLPWLIVGASAAMEVRRRAHGPEAQVQQHKREVTELKSTQRTLEDELKETKAMLEQEKAAREQELLRVADLERIKNEIEERMSLLSREADDLSRENMKLRDDFAALEDKSQGYLKSHLALEDAADALKEENTSLMKQLEEMSAVDREAQVREMLQELRDAISEAMQAFTGGSCGVEELRSKLADLGVVVDCSSEQLDAIRGDVASSETMQETITQQFECQMLSVMEDRSRLEHLMTIASGLAHKRIGAPAPAAPAQTPQLTTVAEEAAAAERAHPLQAFGASMALARLPPGAVTASLAIAAASGATESEATKENAGTRAASAPALPNTVAPPAKATKRTQLNKYEGLVIEQAPALQDISASHDNALASPHIAPADQKQTKGRKVGGFGFSFKGLPSRKKNQGLPAAGNLLQASSMEADFGDMKLVTK